MGRRVLFVPAQPVQLPVCCCCRVLGQKEARAVLLQECSLDGFAPSSTCQANASPEPSISMMRQKSCAGGFAVEPRQQSCSFCSERGIFRLLAWSPVTFVFCSGRASKQWLCSTIVRLQMHSAASQSKLEASFEAPHTVGYAGLDLGCNFVTLAICNLTDEMSSAKFCVVIEIY